MTVRGALAAVVLFAGAVPSAHAWNDFGHMTVAAVAYRHLTPRTRARVQELLALNPYTADVWPSMLPAGTAGETRDAMIFMLAATWPDRIKRDDRYVNDGSRNGDRPPPGSSGTRNVGYRDRARHKYWHFVDTPFADDATRLPPIPRPNAATQIAAFRAVLASSAPDELKSYDLVWLLHLVGDVHQPLHCATRVSRFERGGDAGGNGVGVRCSRCPAGLHVYWDGAAGGGWSLRGAATLARNLPAPDGTLAGRRDEKTWIAESFQAARHDVYVAPVGAGHGPFTLSADYRSRALAVARERVALAGVRLAHLLNDELR